jgi:tRNA 2-thiocytidine biosynthesis protein TtcA
VLSTKLERLLCEHIRTANGKWDLFHPGERLIVGVSGGKDSLSCLRLLSLFELKLIAVYVDLFGMHDDNIEAYCSQYAEYQHITSDRLNGLNNHKNPCFSCSRERRRVLLEAAERHDCTKIVLGHHKNDVVETLLMNQIYSREISTMMPKQPLFEGKYHIIRPIYTVPEPLLVTYVREQKMPVTDRSCNYSADMKRDLIREVLKTIQKNSPGIDVIENIFSSMSQIRGSFLPDTSP